jgi:hypothetical protein
VTEAACSRLNVSFSKASWGMELFIYYCFLPLKQRSKFSSRKNRFTQKEVTREFSISLKPLRRILLILQFSKYPDYSCSWYVEIEKLLVREENWYCIVLSGVAVLWHITFRFTIYNSCQ